MVGGRTAELLELCLTTLPPGTLSDMRLPWAESQGSGPAFPTSSPEAAAAGGWATPRSPETRDPEGLRGHPRVPPSQFVFH